MQFRQYSFGRSQYFFLPLVKQHFESIDLHVFLECMCAEALANVLCVPSVDPWLSDKRALPWLSDFYRICTLLNEIIKPFSCADLAFPCTPKIRPFDHFHDACSRLSILVHASMFYVCRDFFFSTIDYIAWAAPLCGGLRSEGMLHAKTMTACTIRHFLGNKSLYPC